MSKYGTRLSSSTVRADFEPPLLTLGKYKSPYYVSTRTLTLLVLHPTLLYRVMYYPLYSQEDVMGFGSVQVRPWCWTHPMWMIR